MHQKKLRVWFLVEVSMGDNRLMFLSHIDVSSSHLSLSTKYIFSEDIYMTVWMYHSYLSIHLLKDILVASKFW